MSFGARIIMKREEAKEILRTVREQRCHSPQLKGASPPLAAGKTARRSEPAAPGLQRGRGYGWGRGYGSRTGSGALGRGSVRRPAALGGLGALPCRSVSAALPAHTRT